MNPYSLAPMEGVTQLECLSAEKKIGSRAASGLCTG